TVIDWSPGVSGPWTTITPAAWAGFTDQKVESDTFIGYRLFVGSDESGNFLPVGSLTNETFSTTANVTDMPQARYITRYRDRMYVANLKIGSTLQPYRVVFSSVPVSGTLSW